MWLKRITLNNFKSIENLTLEFTPGINVIFGENGTGKTNIIKGILKLLGPSYPGPNSFQKEDFFCLDDRKNLRIELIFQSNKKEISIRWDFDGREKKRLIQDDDKFLTSEERETFCPLHIPPNRDIKDLPGSSKWTPIGRIIFELSRMIERNSDVKDRFIAKMDEGREVLEESPEYSQFREKLGKYTSQQIGQRGENIDIHLDLLDHRHILKTLQIFENLGDEQYNLSEGGQGVQSNVTIAALRAFSDIRGGSFFIIADEPEAYLHPLAQRSLCRIFESISQSGTQIIITTHSPHFISSKYIPGLHKVWMDGNQTKSQIVNIESLCKLKGKRMGSSIDVNRMNAHLQRMLSLDVKEGLFGNYIVLCEGESEWAGLDIWSQYFDFDLARKGIAIVPAQGKFSMIDLAEFYHNFGIPVYVIFDSDENKTGDERKKHAQHNRWLLQFADARIEDFPKTVINELYSVFSQDFEHVLEQTDPHYKIKETEVNRELGLKAGHNKGIRAKFVALKYQDEKLPIPEIIEDLLEAIRNFSSH